MRRAAVEAITVGLYAWWVAGLAHFTRASTVAVLVSGVLVLVWGSRHRLPRRAQPLPRSGLVAWAVLVGAVLAVELVAYRSTPRETHPTLSSMADAALQPRPVAALAFLAWLALGWQLARR
ncbi:MAG: hypothetical protein M3144_03445 [Actinomycetota bacterium]|nr:hypothetical protein [Actinomycetota bacterium]